MHKQSLSIANRERTFIHSVEINGLNSMCFQKQLTKKEIDAKYDAGSYAVCQAWRDAAWQGCEAEPTPEETNQAGELRTRPTGDNQEAAQAC